MAQLIEHKIHGNGDVLDSRDNKGYKLLVKFEDGVFRWVRRDEIRFLTGGHYSLRT